MPIQVTPDPCTRGRAPLFCGRRPPEPRTPACEGATPKKPVVLSQVAPLTGVATKTKHKRNIGNHKKSWRADDRFHLKLTESCNAPANIRISAIIQQLGVITAFQLPCLGAYVSLCVYATLTGETYPDTNYNLMTLHTLEIPQYSNVA